MLIEGGRVLLGTETADTSLQVAGRDIVAVGSDHGRGSQSIDAGDLLVLPGIVDLHGDAFERQMMPRPGVDFPIDVALVDSDRQWFKSHLGLEVCSTSREVSFCAYTLGKAQLLVVPDALLDFFKKRTPPAPPQASVSCPSLTRFPSSPSTPALPPSLPYQSARSAFNRAAVRTQ